MISPTNSRPLTGGGGGSISSDISKSDVNFYDYDGTLLHSYTKSKFFALSALPDLPTRKGLTCQGWNYTLSDAQEYVTSYGVLDIGATYITDDGKTRLYIRIAAYGRMTVPLYFSQTVANGVVIDWGDGSSTETLSGTSYVNTSHTYTSIGDYVITLEVISGVLNLNPSGSLGYSIMGSTETSGIVYCNMLRRVEIGSNVVYIGAFDKCRSLTSVVIPNSVTHFGPNAFNSCHSLTFVVIPNSTIYLAQYMFYDCCSLTSVVIPNGRIYSYLFYNCQSLASVVIPSSFTSIDDNTFFHCYSLASVVIPSSVTSIGATAFSGCYGMAFYDFSSFESVPTIKSTSFNNIPSDCKIVVPDSLYNSWKSATNWSSYASNIVKSSSFNG